MRSQNYSDISNGLGEACPVIPKVLAINQSEISQEWVEVWGWFFCMWLDIMSRKVWPCSRFIVGKGGHTTPSPPPFLRSPFLEIQDFPPVIGLRGKQKNKSGKMKSWCNAFCLLFLGQIYENWVLVRERNVMLLLETVTHIATTWTVTCIILVMYIMHSRNF